MPITSSNSFPSLPSYTPSGSFQSLSDLPSPIMSPTSIMPSSTSKSLPVSTTTSHPTTVSKSTSNSSLTSPTKTPNSSSKNYHPYLIHSSASSLLTRTNSSPAQPPSSPSHHRSSRSMSSLNYILDNPNDPKEDRRKSMESPSSQRIRPGVKRSGTLPEFLNRGGKDKVDKKERDIDLPMNPKLWTPSELAQYLGYTLRTGGPEGTGHILPAPLVEDIKSWVLRQRVSGRDFLKGSSDGWGNTTRPPPFLPLLQTIARRLRRHSLSGRIESVPSNPDDSFGKGSILLEENEDEEQEDELTGVKRMANAFDAKSSTSSVSDSGTSGDEEDNGMGKLKAQLTGESVTERWKAWEDKLDINRSRKVSDVSSMGSISEQEGYTSSVSAKLTDHLPEEEQDEEEEQGGGTIKAPPPQAAVLNFTEGLTPPPPYTSSFPDPEPMKSRAMPTLVECLTPERTREREEGRFSVTPTPERPSGRGNAGLGIMTPSPSPDSTPCRSTRRDEGSSFSSSSPSEHLKKISNHHDVNPYAALRRRSSSGPKYPSVRNLNMQLVNGQADTQGEEAEGEGEEEEEGYLRPAQKSPAAANFAGEELKGSRWTTARRVTLRPSKVQSIFDETNSATSTSSSMIMDRQSHDQGEGDKRKMEEQMEVLMNRIKELEDRLEYVTSTTDDRSPRKRKNRDMVNNDDHTRSILDLLGLGSSARREDEDDKLPRTVRELPVYLFLVGFGVGAVMVRVLFGRSR
ncbi:hypothetical protein I204_05341 [Kwoniella mangroviensis CBS 8886]|nr:hypothetical protein I204_05341 [Kwoniella mangroviensis CBS 8886]